MYAEAPHNAPYRRERHEPQKGDARGAKSPKSVLHVYRHTSVRPAFLGDVLVRTDPATTAWREQVIRTEVDALADLVASGALHDGVPGTWARDLAVLLWPLIAAPPRTSEHPRVVRPGVARTGAGRAPGGRGRVGRAGKRGNWRRQGEGGFATPQILHGPRGNRRRHDATGSVTPHISRRARGCPSNPA